MSSYEPPVPTPTPGPAPGHRWDLGEALAYGWARLQANISQVVLAMLVVLAAGAVVLGLVSVLQSLLLDSREVVFDSSTGEFRTVSEGSGLVTRLVVNALTTGLALVVMQLVAAGLVRGALGVTDGREFTVGEMFRTDKVGPVLVTSLVVGGLVFAGTLLCYLPGLLAAYLTSYALYFVLDQDLAPVDAVRASVELVRDNVGPTLLWYVVGGFVALLGLLACGVGLLLTVPLVVIGTAYTYRTLTGRRVAA